MKEIGRNVKCAKGNVIKLHDVCRSVSTNEIVIVAEGVNEKHQLKGLIADNEVTGAGDWLSVYPNGELEVLCNLTDGATMCPVCDEVMTKEDECYHCGECGNVEDL